MTLYRGTQNLLLKTTNTIPKLNFLLIKTSWISFQILSKIEFDFIAQQTH